jgi:glycolate oxidase
MEQIINLEDSVSDIVIKQFQEIVGKNYVILDEETKLVFECDGLTSIKVKPEIVILPATITEVQSIVKICYEHSIPVVTRGAGTGLSAGATPYKKGVLLVMSRFDKILSIDPIARQARVQPGVTNSAVSQATKKYNLYYAPDPSSQIACTVGGNIAENSGGVHCLKYGLTIHNLLALKIVTAEGNLLNLGHGELDYQGYDLLALLTGSEGLLGIVVEITVKLLPIPDTVKLIMAGYQSLRQASDTVQQIIASGVVPAALEMMDSLAIQAAESFTNAGYPLNAEALLLCEIDGTEEEVKVQLSKVEKVMRHNNPVSLQIAENETERLLYWKGRKSAFPAVGRLSPDYICMDGSIPKRELASVLEGITALSKERGLAVANVFHAGDGNLHPLILFNAAIPGQLETAEQLGGEILELCVKAGGSITGEHGVGLEKIKQMPAQFTDNEIQQFHTIKSAMDERLILNPGKAIPQLKQCQEYRSIRSVGL